VAALAALGPAPSRDPAKDAYGKAAAGVQAPSERKRATRRRRSRSPVGRGPEALRAPSRGVGARGADGRQAASGLLRPPSAVLSKWDWHGMSSPAVRRLWAKVAWNECRLSPPTPTAPIRGKPLAIATTPYCHDTARLETKPLAQGVADLPFSSRPAVVIPVQ